MTEPSSQAAVCATVLNVDDSPDNLTLISGLLKDRYCIKVADDGQKALSIARQPVPPDLILLDVMMPVLTGHEVCRVRKPDLATRRIPINFLTAMAGSDDEKLGLEIGGADTIAKPGAPAARRFADSDFDLAHKADYQSRAAAPAG